MQKDLSTVLAVSQSIASAALPLVALAQPQAINVAPVPITTLTGAVQYICLAVNWFFTFLIVLAIIFVIVAGFKYLTAGGDPENIKKASHMLIYAAVAIAVGIVAKGVPLIIGSFFTGAANFRGC